MANVYEKDQLKRLKALDFARQALPGADASALVKAASVFFNYIDKDEVVEEKTRKTNGR